MFIKDVKFSGEGAEQGKRECLEDRDLQVKKASGEGGMRAELEEVSDGEYFGQRGDSFTSWVGHAQQVPGAAGGRHGWSPGGKGRGRSCSTSEARVRLSPLL